MINLFEANEKKVRFFAQDKVKEARKHFNEGWWKGFAFATLCMTAGVVVGSKIINNKDSKEEA